MAIKFKVSGINKAARSITNQINAIIASSSIHKETARDVERFIRMGENPETGGRLPDLKTSTIEKRKQIAKNNTTHGKYMAERSNLTLTGKLLEGLFSRFNKGTGILTITVKGNHPGYKKAKKKKGSKRTSPKKKTKKKDKIKRITIVGYLEDKGFPVLEVSDDFIQRLVKRLEERLRLL